MGILDVINTRSGNARIPKQLTQYASGYALSSTRGPDERKYTLVSAVTNKEAAHHL